MDDAKIVNGAARKAVDSHDGSRLSGVVQDSDGFHQPRSSASNFSRTSVITNGSTKDHIDSIAGFSLPASNVNMRVKMIFDFDQTVSAFDSCEWLVKFFKVFRSRIPPHIKSEYKDPGVPYEEFMNEVFREFCNEGKDVNELLQHMRRLPLIDGYMQLFARVRKERNVFEHPIILSDSFVPIIKQALLGSGIDADATNLRVIAHPCQVLHSDTSSSLTYFQAHGLMNQIQCDACPTRLCKGMAMQQMFPFLQFEPSNSGKAVNRNPEHNPAPFTTVELETVHHKLLIVYSGDGKNDFCALKSLRSCDIGMYKNNSPLATLVASRAGELRCRVFGWENAYDILRFVDEALSAGKHQ